jgi:protein involved in polysaccharide export with SLBB domain
MQENQTIDINGEVLNPGTYPYSKKMKLLDALQLAKGFKESASNIIEVSRLKNQEVEIFRFNYSKNKVDSINMELKPFDMISVRKNINFNLMKVVTLKGEFSYPGDYSIARENERVSDVLKRCEGLTKIANKFSVRIERRIKIIKKEDSLDRTEKEELIIVPINYTKMIRKNAGKSNPIIRDRDVIIVDQLSEVVKVSGEVELTSEIPLRKTKNAKYYINAVGGFKETALKKSVYVIYANGAAKQTKRFLGIRFYPKPTAGSNIVVTKKSDREKKLDTSEIIGLSSILSTITAMTVAIINQITP